MNTEPQTHSYKGFTIHRSEGQYPTYSMDSVHGRLSGARTLKEVKAFLDLMLKNENDPIECQHTNTALSYTYIECKDCGWVKTDSGRDWGDNANKWFERLPD